MADTVITITIPDAQWSTVQSAYAHTDGEGNAVTINADYFKQKWMSELRAKVKSYDKGRVSVTYSTFSPS